MSFLVIDNLMETIPFLNLFVFKKKSSSLGQIVFEIPQDKALGKDNEVYVVYPSIKVLDELREEVPVYLRSEDLYYDRFKGKMIYKMVYQIPKEYSGSFTMLVESGNKSSGDILYAKSLRSFSKSNAVALAGLVGQAAYYAVTKDKMRYVLATKFGNFWLRYKEDNNEVAQVE